MLYIRFPRSLRNGEDRCTSAASNPATKPSLRVERANKAQIDRRVEGVSVALDCRAFGVSETCVRYCPKLKDKNEEIADLLVGLTDARTTWSFGRCFLHLRKPMRGTTNVSIASIAKAQAYTVVCS